jgi:ribonuclease HI
MHNPYAVYVYCDGALDYKKNNPGGVGFQICFPESVQLDPIEISIGTFHGGNIEQLELEALIQAMKGTRKIFEEYSQKLRNINHIIFITDRYGLREDDKTSSYRINIWRQNKWKNYEGKPIKNHKLLDELDKARTKLRNTSYAKVNIEWRPRKQNRKADKLAKAGKYSGMPNLKLQKKGQKIGKRKFSGPEVSYLILNPKDKLHVNIFRKDPVQDQWEIWAEICQGEMTGKKIKVYCDDLLESKLKRGNEFIVRIKDVFNYHITIYRTIEKPTSTP